MRGAGDGKISVAEVGLTISFIKPGIGDQPEEGQRSEIRSEEKLLLQGFSNKILNRKTPDAVQ